MPLRRLIFLASLVRAVTAMNPSAALEGAHDTDRPLTGRATGTTRLDLSTGTVTIDFTGHLSHLGAMTGHDALTVKVTDSTCSYTGTTTFVAANGDELFSTVAGSGTFTTATTAQSTHTGTITGGTGRFAGASGTYTDTASFVLVSASGPIQISHLTAAFEGEISY